MSSCRTSVWRECGRAVRLVKAAHQWMVRGKNDMVVNPGKLLGKRIFRYAEMMIQTGLRTPADVHDGIDVSGGSNPLPHKARPNNQLRKQEMLHRRAGNDHSVKFFVPHF